jgi:hypothetical protein
LFRRNGAILGCTYHPEPSTILLFRKTSFRFMPLSLALAEAEEMIKILALV